MTPMQEAAESAKRAAANGQDKRNPFLINIEDARLIPNTRLTRRNPAYRIYKGDVHATVADRKRYLASNGLVPEEIGNAAGEPFDIGKATKEELVAFAGAEFGQTLDPGMHLATMRKKVNEWAAEAESSLG